MSHVNKVQLIRVKMIRVAAIRIPMYCLAYSASFAFQLILFL
jgi:hypothetical protein